MNKYAECGFFHTQRAIVGRRAKMGNCDSHIYHVLGHILGITWKLQGLYPAIDGLRIVAG